MASDRPEHHSELDDLLNIVWKDKPSKKQPYSSCGFSGSRLRMVEFAERREDCLKQTESTRRHIWIGSQFQSPPYGAILTGSLCRHHQGTPPPNT